MRWLSILPLLLGAAAVFQGSINRRLADAWGLSAAVVVNNCVIFIAGALLYVAVNARPQFFPELFRSHIDWSSFRPWYLIPGLLGLSLVACIPWAISRLGALQVFVGIVAAQMVVSVIWDAVAEQRMPTFARIAGACLTVVGVVLVSYKSAGK